MTRRQKAVFFILLIILAASLIAVYHEAILVSLGEYLITEQRLEKADAIFILGGSVPDRILEGIDVYKQGYAPVIILSREQKPRGYDALLKLGIKLPEGYDLNRMIATKLGVPASSIFVINRRVNSTYMEMQVLHDFLKEKNIKSVILVSSKSHTTRVTKLFNFVNNGKKIKGITRPSKYDDFDPENWWKSRDQTKQIIFEYQKLIHYYLIVVKSALTYS
ncbi:MAG TPA: YdcF family protein [Thermodesulfobacteriota bacterium]|nr:YdcF family protein [Thermodesulfobacteriota bacterium]